MVLLLRWVIEFRRAVVDGSMGLPSIVGDAVHAMASCGAPWNTAGELGPEEGVMLYMSSKVLSRFWSMCDCSVSVDFWKRAPLVTRAVTS